MPVVGAGPDPIGDRDADGDGGGGPAVAVSSTAGVGRRARPGCRSPWWAIRSEAWTLAGGPGGPSSTWSHASAAVVVPRAAGPSRSAPRWGRWGGDHAPSPARRGWPRRRRARASRGVQLHQALGVGRRRRDILVRSAGPSPRRHVVGRRFGAAGPPGSARSAPGCRRARRARARASARRRRRPPRDRRERPRGRSAAAQARARSRGRNPLVRAWRGRPSTEFAACRPPRVAASMQPAFRPVSVQSPASARFS